MILNPGSSDSSGSLDRTVSEGEVVRKILATDPVIYAWMFCDVALLRAPGLLLLVRLSLVTEDNALSGVPLPISWEARPFLYCAHSGCVLRKVQNDCRDFRRC